jgi:uncharacterized protein (DUF1499 family)
MPTNWTPPLRRGLPLIVAVAILIVVLGALAQICSGFGYRWGVWPLGVAFRLFFFGAWVALLGGVLAVVGAIATRPGTSRRGFGASVIAAVIAAASFATAMRWYAAAKHAAPIHDITTDTSNPPEFVAILPLRASAPNPAKYTGPALADSQRAAYPDIQPVMLNVAPAAAFHAALDVARGMGWQMVAADSSAGRIEATATTPWYGFKDDVVIRVEPAPQGSRVDVRSVSRVGGSDVGTNARRIKAYVARLTNHA